MNKKILIILFLMISASLVYAHDPIIFEIPIKLNVTGDIDVMSGISYGEISMNPVNQSFFVLGASEGAYINITLLNNSDLYDLTILKPDKYLVSIPPGYNLKYNETFTLHFNYEIGNYSLQLIPKKVGFVNDAIRLDFSGFSNNTETEIFNISANIKGNVSIISDINFGEMYTGMNLQPEKPIFTINTVSTGANITLTLQDAANNSENFYFVKPNNVITPLINNQSLNYTLDSSTGNYSIRIISQKVGVVNGIVKFEFDGDELYFNTK